MINVREKKPLSEEPQSYSRRHLLDTSSVSNQLSGSPCRLPSVRPRFNWQLSHWDLLYSVCLFCVCFLLPYQQPPLGGNDRWPLCKHNSMFGIFEIARPAVWTRSCRAAKLVVVLVFSPSSGEPVQDSLKYMNDGETYSYKVANSGTEQKKYFKILKFPFSSPRWLIGDVPRLQPASNGKPLGPFEPDRRVN